MMFISEEAGPKVTSGKAVASLALGVLFFFACLSGIPAILLGREALGDIKRSGGRLRGRGMAIAGIVLGVIGCLFTLACSCPRSARPARPPGGASASTTSSRSASPCTTTTTRTAACPPPRSPTRDGRPLLSWRVAILPYLECDPRYSKFHLDEPWDSPHNLALLEPTAVLLRLPQRRHPEAGDDRLPGRRRPRHGVHPGLQAFAVPGLHRRSRQHPPRRRVPPRRPLDQARRPPLRHDRPPLRARQPPRLPQQRLQRPVRRRLRPVPQELDHTRASSARSSPAMGTR